MTWPAFGIITGSQAAFETTFTEKTEQASCRGLLEGFLQLRTDSMEASRDVFWIFFTNGAKSCENHQRSFKNLVTQSLKTVILTVNLNASRDLF
jgi:hypothetical protein